MEKLPMKNPFAGTFIVFEGIDGCGKSTQAKLLQEHLLLKGFKAIFTMEPSKEKYGLRIREILENKEKIDPKEFQELFIKNRLYHLINIINPVLRKECIAICDRYYFSTLAYGASDEVPESWIIKKHEEILGTRFIRPDFTFIIRISPETAFERKQKEKADKKLDRFETLEYMKKISENYEKLASQENVFVIDGENSAETVQKDIVEILRKNFKSFI